MMTMMIMMVIPTQEMHGQPTHVHGKIRTMTANLTTLLARLESIQLCLPIKMMMATVFLMN